MERTASRRYKFKVATQDDLLDDMPLGTTIIITANPYAAELFRTIFHSFEAGIATQFPAPNDRKIYIHAKIYVLKM